MRVLRRDRLFRNYGDLADLPPAPVFLVDPGESFMVETAHSDDKELRSAADMTSPAGPMSWNPCTGPIGVVGVRAGDVIAVQIERLRVVGHSMARTDTERGNPPLLPPDVARTRSDFVPIVDGSACFPGGIRIPTRPMLGCFGVVPARPAPEPWRHGGNLDIPDICAGNTVHLRCQRDEAWFGCGDGHAIQGDGEMNGVSLEVALEAVLRIERSPYQSLGGILIESPTKVMMVGLGERLRDGLVEATHELSRFVAQRRSLGTLEAYQFVSHVADVRLGAMWPLWCDQPTNTPVPVVLHLDKALFSPPTADLDEPGD